MSFISAGGVSVAETSTQAGKSNKSKDHYLPSLDGWRAIAILMVVFSHALTTASAHDGGALNLVAFRVGTFGVMLFFAISGYLICTRLLIEEETAGSISLRLFYIRRIFRILPPAYVYLAIVAFTVSWSDIAPAAFFYSNYVEPRSWFTGHFWSLAIEEHFYLLWPPILVWVGRRRAIWAGVSLIALTVVLRQIAVHQLPPGADLPGYTHLRLDAFMFPCLLAILLRDARIANCFRMLMTPRIWCSAISVLAAGIIAGVLYPWWREPQRLLQSAILPVLIVATVLRPHDWMARQLNRPWMERIGRVSYSIYLWQQLVFAPMLHNWGVAYLRIPAQVVVVFALAAASYRWIEQPMIAWGKRMASSPANSPALR